LRNPPGEAGLVGLVLADTAVIVVDVGHKAHSLAAGGDAVILHERSLGYALGVTFAATLPCGAPCDALVGHRERLSQPMRLGG
jgi:hypothetical protein